ncbi:MAG TPA: phosphatidate cytidylyltransferase [Rhizomicrobium sp.]
MSRHGHTAAPAASQAPGYRAIRFNWDWVTRPLFGIALAAMVIGAIVGGVPYVAGVAALVGIAAAREWHRMVGERVFGPAFFLSSAVIVAALVAVVLWPHAYYAWAILGSGAVLVGAYAAAAGQGPLWQGAGPLYLGMTPMALVLLRGLPDGGWIIAGMFLAIWATDTGALIVGNLIGGPRLWPSLSPNKTWSGTLGAVAIAAVVEAVYVGVLGGSPVLGGLYGAALAVVAHGGDLFESWVKRAFRRKDSGGLIPGHGGVLDRIDSTLMTAPVLGLAVAVGLNPLFGAHP